MARATMKLNRLFLACVVVVLMAFGCSDTTPEGSNLVAGSVAMVRPPRDIRFVGIESLDGKGFPPDSPANGLTFLVAGDKVRVIDDPGDTVEHRRVRVVVMGGKLDQIEGTLSRSELAPLR